MRTILCIFLIMISLFRQNNDFLYNPSINISNENNKPNIKGEINVPRLLDISDNRIPERQNNIVKKESAEEFKLIVNECYKGMITAYVPSDEDLIILPLLSILSALSISMEMSDDYIRFSISDKPCVIDLINCTLTYNGGNNILELAPGCEHFEYRYWDGIDFYVDIDTLLAFTYSILKIYVSVDYDSRILVITSR